MVYLYRVLLELPGSEGDLLIEPVPIVTERDFEVEGNESGKEMAEGVDVLLESKEIWGKVLWGTKVIELYLSGMMEIEEDVEIDNLAEGCLFWAVV